MGDFEITHELVSGDSRASFWRAAAENRRIPAADLVRVNELGKVVELTVLIRPLVDIAALGSAVGPPLARRRGVVRAFLIRLIGIPLAWIMALSTPLHRVLSSRVGFGASESPVPLGPH